MRILIVDDSKVARLVVKQVLRELGHDEVVEAQNGREALEVVQQKPFDLVISDWLMPDLDGLGFVKALRETKARATPVIMVSSESEVSRIVEILRAGAHAYIRKPFRAEALRAKIVEVKKKLQLAETSMTHALAGSLDEIGFPELVQFLSAQRLSGRLRILSGGRQGAVLFREGVVLGAELEGQSGEEAFFSLAELMGGEFSVQRMDVGSAPGNIGQPMLPLLMEAMRRRDEHARKGKSS